MSRRRRRAKRHRFTSFAVLALAAICVWSIWGNTALVRTDIVYRSESVPRELDGFVIAQVSDLHDAQLGSDNEDIVSLLKQVRPDIIVLTGDMVDSNRVNLERSISLAERLTAVAPVYYTNGNHEAALSFDTYHRFTKGLSDAGVELLEDRAVNVRYKNALLRIIGLNDLGFIQGGLSEKKSALKKSLTLLIDDNMFNLVLAHRPELIDIYASCGAQLVLSGHAHGGQIRLPFIGGLYSPGQGILPKYDSGLYTQGNTAMIVSRGLGNSNFPLRVNNRPEVVVITLRSAG